MSAATTSVAVNAMRPERKEDEMGEKQLCKHSEFVGYCYICERDRAAAAEARVVELEQRVKVLEAEREIYRKALTVISTTVAGLDQQPKPVIHRSIKSIQAWTREALK